MNGVNTGKKKNYIIYVIIVMGLAIIVLLALYISSWNNGKALEVSLTEKSDELERQQKLYADLEVNANNQKTELQKWKEKAEELLNIQEDEPVITSAQIEEQLSAISELVTQKYMYSNADNGEYSNTWGFGWDMPFSEKSLIVKYDGTIKAGIDLKGITVNVDEDHHKITITLPKSKVTDNNVPQETIETFAIKDGFFNKVTPDDSNNLIVEGKKRMEAKAIERGLLTEADNEAKTIIRAFLNVLPGIDKYTVTIK